MSIFKNFQSTEMIPSESPQKESLGSRIAKFRKEQNLTQEQFAEMLGVSPQAVSKWENDISCPDIMLLPKIAEIFSVSIDELMGVEKAASRNEAEQKSDLPILGKMRKLKIHIYDPKNNGRPVNISIPIPFVTKVADLGLKLSGVLGKDILSENQIEKIFEQVKSGDKTEIIDLVTDDGARINIEIS